MRPCSFLRFILASATIFPLAACNFPGQTAAPTSTPIPPTETPVPSPTPLSPTDTPTVEPSPTWTATLPPLLPSSTSTPIPTVTIRPLPGAKFEGTFVGGIIIFRTNDKGTMVIPKEIRIKKAVCNEGKTMSDLLAFDPPPFFPIEDGKFSIVRDTQLTLTGFFTAPNQVRGSIQMKLSKEGKVCTIGPLVWVASAP